MMVNMLIFIFIILLGPPYSLLSTYIFIGFALVPHLGRQTRQSPQERLCSSHDPAVVVADAWNILWPGPGQKRVLIGLQNVGISPRKMGSLWRPSTASISGGVLPGNCDVKKPFWMSMSRIIIVTPNWAPNWWCFRWIILCSTSFFGGLPYFRKNKQSFGPPYEFYSTSCWNYWETMTWREKGLWEVAADTVAKLDSQVAWHFERVATPSSNGAFLKYGWPKSSKSLDPF